VAATELVLDASVLLACWLPETAESRAYAEAVLRDDRGGYTFHAPLVFEVEVAAGLMRAMRARRITLETMHAALDVIEAVGVVVHSYPYTSRALIDIAGRHHLQVSDALYFHLAKSYGLPLATLDGGLRTACRAHGVKLFAP
jgi:predicted nucleic acid-binding protein